MQTLHLTLSCPTPDSFRVQQVAGMFDVPLAERAVEHITLDLPPLGDNWRIGFILGPSASGKTALARHLFGDAYYESAAWPPDRAIVDCFEPLTIRQITRLFTAVGFSSPPAWIKPYHVLSTGQRFRCDLARALSRNVGWAERSEAHAHGTIPSIDSPPTRRVGLADSAHPTRTPRLVFDEFTSVVDRTSARIASAALARALRTGAIPGQFVAVTCHDDIAPWLAPDWIIDMRTKTFTRSRAKRPPIKLHIHHCNRALWPMFARHHYLSGSLAPTARCFAALWNNEPVAFCATLPLIGRRDHWRITRLVVLPDYQGVGIGMHLAEAVAQLHRAEGRRINITASHPAVLTHCRRSPRWRLVQLRRTGSRPSRKYHNYNGSLTRPVASFEFVPAAEGRALESPGRSPGLAKHIDNIKAQWAATT
jgi:GNAT superfamily N-acetyltransferase